MKKKNPRPHNIQHPATSDSIDTHPDINSERGVCRDFLRNVCTRRDGCKFQHVIPSVEFCHDFQNTRACSRKHCKYTHGTYEDEQHYLATGALPEHLKPVCLNFLKNKCTRSKCKFLHPTGSYPEGGSNGEIEASQHPLQATQPNGNGPDNTVSSYKDESTRSESESHGPDHDISDTPDQNVYCLGVERKKSKKALKMADVKAIQEFLYQENEFLKMKLNEMQGHLAELQSGNQYLVEENHRLRHTALAVPHSSSMAIAVPHSSSMAITVPHSATNVTALAVPHSSNMTLTVPHSSNMTLAVPHSSSMTLAVPHSASVTALTVPHSGSSVVTALAVPQSSSVTALAVPAVTITSTKQQMVGGTTFAAVPVSIATMTAGTHVPVSITTCTPVSIATVSVAPVQIPPVVSMPASLYPLLTQMCTK